MGRRTKRIDEPVLEAVIRDLTQDGRGVTDLDGKAVFVDAAISGERVRFRRLKRRKNYDEAELVEVLEPSPDRVEPACEYFSYCGGCSLQHLSTEAQLKTKQEGLLDSLQRIGGVQPQTVLQPLVGKPLQYRRRARLGAKLVEKKGRVLVGFREKRKPYIADMRYCQTLSTRLAVLIEPLAGLIDSLSISRQVPQIELSLGDAAVSLVFRVLESPSAKDAEKLQAFATQHEVGIWLQTGGPDTVLPLDPLNAPEPLWYGLPDFNLRMEFSPLDFIQVNQDMNRLMINQALELLGDIEGERVLDLFCGIGNFSLPLATRCGQVVGVELDPRMVAKAQANAKLNNLSNTEFFAADLTKTDEVPDWWADGFDLVVLDPPRTGAQEVLAQVAATGAKRILYISCHPGSLARDAGILTAEYGYQLKSAGAMDMFPQTSHAEAMALFELPASA
jgi:23S rRNA (uracil1939-C5)-methyltransferase